jgi:NitT/TauT family transport system substrate-binding protein
MQEGMIANQIQIGSVAAPAFLVGRDRGLDWKLLSGMMLQDYWLVVNDPTIQSLKDFKPNHKIGVLAPNSIHATTLRKAAQQQLGNPNALDANLQSMTHPAGLQAFQSKQIAAHFTSAPFYWQEVDLGGRVILKSSDLFGGLNTGTALVVMEEFYNQYPAFNQALHKAVQDASKMLREQPDQAATLIAAESGGKTTAEEIKQWVIRNDVEFNTSAKGYLAYAAFLRETNQISKQPQSIDELVLPPLQGKGGN